MKPHSTPMIRDDFHAMIYGIPLKVRRRILPALVRVEQALQLPPEDLCRDGRALRGDLTSPSRAKFLANFKATLEKRKQFFVRYRDSDGWGEPIACTIEQAAKHVHLKPSTLKNKLRYDRGLTSVMRNERELIEVLTKKRFAQL